ncbi:MAG: c-type cytochrome [Bacteroidetes bacterium]|nr:c-type cytochrome [Bacteroidota bacterium]
MLFFLGVSSVKAYEPSAPVNLDDAAFMEGVTKGEELFKANCTACHAMNRKLVGPSMADVWVRWESEEDLVAWIRNSQAFLETGDPYAVSLYDEYNQFPMNSYLQFTDEDIISIIDYMRGYEAYTAQKEAAAGGGTEAADDGGAEAGGETSPYHERSKVVLWVLIGFLVLLLLALSHITGRLNKKANERHGLEGNQSFTLMSMLFSKRVMGIVVLAVMVFVGYSVVSGAVNLGRSQGYMPEQPIKFSHALHAGENQIDCKYCHSGAEKSKHSYIPSTTVCMNCHKYVQEGPKYGKDEIAKIYASTGWDPKTLQFTNAPKPVEWIRIHQLPDHVYFNHSQHVKVGGLECQTCHGNVQEMEVVQQFAPLSMGWCVNCHRQTDVKFNGNEYYETTFERFHNELEMQQRSGVTVEDIGGAECQKCHY